MTRRPLGDLPTPADGQVTPPGQGGVDVRASLPSVRAAEHFHQGRPGGLTEVILSTFGRACIIGAGIVVMGERDPKRLAKYALAGATAVELFVLYYTAPARQSPPGTTA